jgi:hypothetical protein
MLRFGTDTKSNAMPSFSTGTLSNFRLTMGFRRDSFAATIENSVSDGAFGSAEGLGSADTAARVKFNCDSLNDPIISVPDVGDFVGPLGTSSNGSVDVTVEGDADGGIRDFDGDRVTDGDRVGDGVGVLLALDDGGGW